MIQMGLFIAWLSPCSGGCRKSTTAPPPGSSAARSRGELRFPHRSLRFDDGIVSGKAELAKWSVSAALGFRF
jgi:hypothetical protein